MERKTSSHEKLKWLVLTALFAALSYVCLLFIRVPGIAGFLTLDVKDAIVTLGAMFLGPIAAFIISLVVSLVEMISVSTTEFWGFLMNFLGTAVFSILASSIYRHKRTLMGGIAGLSVAVVSMVAVMLVANIFITPIYRGVPTAMVIDLLPMLFVFNLAKGILNAAVVLLLYKPVSNALKAARFIDRREKEKLAIDIKTLIIMAIALVIAFGSTLILLYAI